MIDRISQLEKRVEYHRDLYYDGKQQISDQEFDLLVDKLKKMKPDSPILKKVGAPVKRQKVNLPFILGSLNKIGPSDAAKWLRAHHKDLCLTYKLDGISIYAEWNKGKLTMFCTRGDGHVGQDLLWKANAITKTPIMSIKEPKRVCARGEAIITGTVPAGYKTRRNAAAGIMNRDDSKGMERISIWFHELIKGPKDFDSSFEGINFLNLLGLKVVPYFLIRKESLYDPNRIIEKWSERIKKKAEFSYDMDGLVIAVDSYQRENTEIPENKVAFKISDAPIPTKVTEIEWNVTRTGRVVPVVHIDAIETQGVEIEHPTGHNAQWIKDRGIDKGAVITIVRSGDVIPYITGVVKRVKDINLPKECPSCKTKLVWNKVSGQTDGVDLVCSNAKCSGQLLAFIEYFIRTLGAEGIRKQTLEKLKVKTVEDFYDLEKEQIARVNGLGDLSAEKIISEREKTLTTTEAELLAAFGIPGIAVKNAKTIIDSLKLRNFKEMFKLSGSSIFNKLIPIKGLGPSVISSFVDNIKMYDQLFDFLCKKGLTFKKIKKTNILEGKSFQFTGAASRPREELIALVEQNGGKIASVSRNLDYLVIADPNSASTKAQKARSLGIKMISEEKLMKMLGS